MDERHLKVIGTTAFRDLVVKLRSMHIYYRNWYFISEIEKPSLASKRFGLHVVHGIDVEMREGETYLVLKWYSSDTELHNDKIEIQQLLSELKVDYIKLYNHYLEVWLIRIE